MYFVSGSPQKETLHIEYAMFCIISQLGTKCILRAFEVDESFWTQKQSCITQKVGLEKRCLFFDFVCFSGRHFTQLDFAKKDIGRNFFLKFLHIHLTFSHHISKIWECVLQFWFILILAMCVGYGSTSQLVNHNSIEI